MEEGGSIINTASIQSFDPSPNLIAYASTKAAIVSFTRSLASFAIKQGVRVNAVAPGPVWTPLIPSTMPKEKVRQFGAQTLFGRAAQPAELAPIFVFLASDQLPMSLEKFTVRQGARHRCESSLRRFGSSVLTK
jgi:NAD(P)-dependent dehydrogenase (short-subunit alcohol dehydrogenase family)